MILYLALKKKWYRFTEYGYKLEEYRDINEYWVKRLTYEKHFENVEQLLSKPIKFKEFGSVMLTLGYPKKDDASRHLEKQIDQITIGEGKFEWGAIPGRKYFVIKYKKA